MNRRELRAEGYRFLGHDTRDGGRGGGGGTRGGAGVGDENVFVSMLGNRLPLSIQTYGV